jgi:anti-sigma B factor antagonist
MYLSLRVRSCAGNVIVDIAGDIDMNSGPWLLDCLLRFLRISGTCLLADLSGVTFIDCAGLRMLITACRTAELRASALRFTNLSPQVRRLADLTGLRAALPLAVPREGRLRNPAQSAPATPPGGQPTMCAARALSPGG